MTFCSIVDCLALGVVHSSCLFSSKRFSTSVDPLTPFSPRFPLSRPDPARINSRMQRLATDLRVQRQAEADRIEKLRQTKDRKYSAATGAVGKTFVQERTFKPDKLLPLTGLAFDIEPPPEQRQERKTIKKDSRRQNEHV